MFNNGKYNIMRATEIIRNVLDLIDEIDCPQETGIAAPTEPPVETGVDNNRFKQIVDILSTQRKQQYDNSPREVVASVKSVTVDAGGGLNGPKNPADIKANSISMFPNFQAKG